MREQSYGKAIRSEETGERRGGVLMLTFLFGAGLLLGCAHVFLASKNIGLLQVSGFVLLGIVYAAWMQRMMAGADNGEIFLAAVFFTLALLVALALFCYFAGAFRGGQLLVLACAFFLPSTVAEAGRLFSAFADAPAQAWVYSAEIPDEPPFVYLEKKPMQILLQLENGAVESRTSMAPLSLPLGMAFFYAVKEGKSKEEWQTYFVNESGRPCSWVFYKKRLGLWKTYLHPYETLFENRLKSASKLFAERLPR